MKENLAWYARLGYAERHRRAEKGRRVRLVKTLV